MRGLLALPLAFLLAACSGAVDDGALPPVEPTQAGSLAEPGGPKLIPAEEGDGTRNPDNPFLMAEIGADRRIGELHAAGVMARDPRAGECLDHLQRLKSANFPIDELPLFCAAIDLRMFGPGAESVIIPELPRPEGEESEEGDGFLKELWSSIFG